MLSFGSLISIFFVVCSCSYGASYNHYDLLNAAESGDLDTVKAIIAENKVNLEMRFKEVPAIHAAAENGHIDVVRALLEAGVSASTKNFNNTAPIFRAVVGDHADIIELLYQYGASLNDEVLEFDVYHPVILKTAMEGSYKAAVKLLDLGVDIESVSKPLAGLKIQIGGDTPLIGAAFQGHVNLVQLFLDRGANKFATNIQGNSAIHAAAHKNSPAVLKVLLDSGGFDLQIKNINGFLPVNLAAHSGGEKCLRLLLKAGASVNTGNGTDFIPLITAVRTYNVPMFKEILMWKPFINSYDSVNYTALYHALTANHHDMSRQLLRRGAALGRVEEAKGLIDEWAKYVDTCDWFYGILRSNNLSTKQVSGPSPHLGYCEHIKSLGAHKSIVKLIDQADLYGYDGLVSRLNFKSFTANLDGNFEGVKKAKERAFIDIKHLHKIDYRKNYEMDAEEHNEQLPKILHRFSDKVEPPRPKEDKELTLSEILESTETVRQVHRPPPEDRPPHARDGESVASKGHGHNSEL